jgi:hypothetical protein
MSAALGRAAPGQRPGPAWWTLRWDRIPASSVTSPGAIKLDCRTDLQGRAVSAATTAMIPAVSAPEPDLNRAHSVIR